MLDLFSISPSFSPKQLRMALRPLDVEGARGAFSTMKDQNHPPTSRRIWAYGYEISPPMTQWRLRAIEHFLEREQAEAKRQRRTWQGRFVVEEQVTHIMVVSDSADQKLEVNRRLEAELKKLEAVYSLTSAVPLDDAEDPPFVIPGVILDA